MAWVILNGTVESNGANNMTGFIFLGFLYPHMNFIWGLDAHSEKHILDRNIFLARHFHRKCILYKLQKMQVIAHVFKWICSSHAHTPCCICFPEYSCQPILLLYNVYEKWLSKACLWIFMPSVLNNLSSQERERTSSCDMPDFDFNWQAHIMPRGIRSVKAIYSPTTERCTFIKNVLDNSLE